MKIVYKHIIKNVVSKPFRTLLLVFCIMVCAFVAEISLDITDNLELILKTMIVQMMGTSDIAVTDEVGTNEVYPLSVDSDQLLVFTQDVAVVKDMREEYAFFQKVEYNVETFDFEKAYEMRFVPSKLSLSDEEIVISTRLAKELELKEGDSITLLDREEKERSFRVKSVLPNSGHSNGRSLAIVNDNAFHTVYGDVKANNTYIDVKDDTAVKTVQKEIEDGKLGTKATIFLDSEENKETMKTLKMTLLLVFSICLFLVIFVTMSVSKRIINERMSVVGTLRSLGMTPGFTTKLLIIENAIYGLLGAGIGVGLYALIRTPLLTSVLSPTASEGLEIHMDIPQMAISHIILVLVVGVLIECACPIKEILSATKMSIRDIIFDNKDTAFRMSRTGMVVGAVSFVIAAGTYFTASRMETLFICFVCCIVAVSQLFPFVIKGCSILFAKLFQKWEMPVAQMAARETYARKSTVGSSVLCVTAATISIILFVLLASMNALYNIHTYDTDLIFDLNYKTEASPLSYIKDLDGVTEVEGIQSNNYDLIMNGKKATDVTVVGLNEGGFHLFTAIKNAPTHMERDAFYLDEHLAKKYEIAIGDEVDITLDSSNFLPIKKKLKCAGYIDSFELDTTANTVLISSTLYQECFHDYVSKLLVKCDNPEEIKETVMNYSATYINEVKTNEEHYQELQMNKQKMQGMFTLIIILGVGITVIGMISNQLIGFEGRKRECAVLISTAMTRDKCAKMMFLESVIASGVALATAFITASIVFVPLKKLLNVLDLVVPITYYADLYILFLLILWVVFSLISVFPIRALYKMKLAQQLKYE